ncbi:hypothetical protein CEXT_45601 [Caerostris extrusa]|uniref:Uncharacterized protein n=1 Tax=Caerostris extrusa TaxID=172846 RepID=A0AAV4NK88_CAEEX|nr:hypothetical protein CEXT_45601 [Caerostris extrusa]
MRVIFRNRTINRLNTTNSTTNSLEPFHHSPKLSRTITTTWSIFLKKVRTPPGVGTHKCRPQSSFPCGQSIRRVHGSAVHSEWGGKREENSRKRDDLAMARKLYLCKGIAEQEPNLEPADGSAKDRGKGALIAGLERLGNVFHR